MANKYCDLDLTTGGNTGADWANAWKTQADWQGGCAAGDVVFVRGTQTLGATNAFATAGTGGNPIIHIGVNSSGVVEEGNRPELDGNSSYKPIQVTASYNYFENFVCSNGATYCVDAAGVANVGFYNIEATGSSSIGLILYRNSYVKRCQIHANVNGLWMGSRQNEAEDNAIYTNSTAGAYITAGNTLTNSLLYDNGIGINIATGSGFVSGCIIDDNTTGLQLTNAVDSVCAYSVFTNNTTAVVNTTGFLRSYLNAFWNNSTKIGTAANYINIDANGTYADVDLDGNPWSNQPGRVYEVSADDADMVGYAIILNSLNTSYRDLGAMIAERAAAGGGGRQPRLRINGA